MPYLNEPFNPNDEPEAQNSAFEPIPNGIYPMQITDSDIKDTKSGNGQYVEFEMTIVGDKYAERRIWARMNIINQSPKAVEIGRGQLAQLCKACGKGQIRQTEELHGIVFKGHVAIAPAKGGYPASNVIRNFAAMTGDGGMTSAAKEAPNVPEDAPWG